MPIEGLIAGLGCTACLFCTALQAQTPFVMGVGTHLMNFDAPSQPALQLAANAGFNSVRDDAFWSTVQPAPDQWRIIEPWRSYLNAARGLSLQSLAILDYSTYFHDNAKPRTPEVKAAYLKYVDYVTRQLGNSVAFYEIWNEWDLEAPKDPQLSADYATLVRETAPLIRKNTTGASGKPALILAGAITAQGMDEGFADRLIEAGMLDHVDGLSVHPYAHCAPDGRNNPEGWVSWLRNYEQHIREKAGRTVPLYLTEMGWPSHKGPCGVSPGTQAAYSARTLLLSRTVPNTKGIWWYDLRNDGPERTDQEHNFGILNENLSPKPAYAAVKAVADIVSNYAWDAKASSEVADAFQLHFHNSSEHVIAAWSGGEPRSVLITSDRSMAGPVMYVDTADPAKGLMSGRTFWQCQDRQCSVQVTLTGFPKIISLNSESAIARH